MIDRNYQIATRKVLLSVVFVLFFLGEFMFASGQVGWKKNRASSQNMKQQKTADCLEALRVEDSFLWAWVNRDSESGIKLMSEHLKKEIHDDSWLRQYMMGLSNPRHQAFEIEEACESSSVSYSFAVTLYELASSESEGSSYRGAIILVKEGGVWRVDSLPSSSDTIE